MWIYLWTSYQCDSTHSYVFALRSFMRIEQRLSRAKVSPWEFILAVEMKWNRIAYLLQSSATGTATYRKIIQDLFAYHESNRDFLLAWFAESYDDFVENLLSKDNLTHYKAMERILNLPSNHHTRSRASPRSPGIITRLMPSFHQMERRKRRQRTGLPRLPIQVIRSVGGVISTYAALRPVIYGHSVMILKHGEIEIVPKWWLPSSKSLSL
jgi:hypothetical protein